VQQPILEDLQLQRADGADDRIAHSPPRAWKIWMPLLRELLEAFLELLALRASFARTRRRSPREPGSSAYSNAVPRRGVPDPQSAGVEQPDHVRRPGFLDHLPLRAEELVRHGEPQRLLIAAGAHPCPGRTGPSRRAGRRAGRGGRDPCSPDLEDESGELRHRRNHRAPVDAQTGARRRSQPDEGRRGTRRPPLRSSPIRRTPATARRSTPSAGRTESPPPPGARSPPAPSRQPAVRRAALPALVEELHHAFEVLPLPQRPVMGQVRIRAPPPLSCRLSNGSRPSGRAC